MRANVGLRQGWGREGTQIWRELNQGPQLEREQSGAWNIVGSVYYEVIFCH